MDTNNHLSMNDVIGKHYIIVEVLAKDAFEILYLVRDSNRAGSLFILKELFFETFCSREDNIVIIQSEAQSVFFKQKKATINKANKLKNNHTSTELKTFGYFEENNTVYTIMEYSADAKMSDYLEFETELIKKENLEKNTLPTKNLKYILLAALLLLLGYLGFMAYQKTNESTIDEKKLTPKIELKDYPENTQETNISDNSNKNKVNTNTNTNTIRSSQEPLVIENNTTETEILIPKSNSSKERNSTEEHNQTSLAQNITSLIVDENLSIVESQTTTIKQETSIDKFSNIEIKKFLDAYIDSSSQASVTEVLEFYDVKVEKYFKFKNVSHELIRKDKLKYNKKWAHREFSIIDFKVLKKYTKKQQNYVNVQTTTKWFMSNNKGSTLKGTSRGFMKLKSTDDGFKIVSIYGLK
ncbi:MAG: Unknown protein [uncultured Sulfurovum sp.]|uniref:Uncharacterized protein n=1 Tax=uncultured Sulfurovum sp. TaxID=269237 RepID=A0A6S6S938_9BACT|nr:MAG: Unknown protein [uncultured Sulfurovum sp.]